MKTKSDIVRHWIGGRWQPASGSEWGSVMNPGKGEQIARVPLGGPADVDAAVKAAQQAFLAWSETPAPRRASILFRFRASLERHFESLARLVTLENGKTIEEARGDVRRGIEVVEFACGISHLAKGESLPQVADMIDAVTMREPLGICAGITPFNFPAMVPMWMFPVAIACGNTFILKPSEKVPLTVCRLAEIFAEAGLPAGVFNVVHGGRDVVDALCSHPDIAAVSFVGSSRVAAHVHQLASQHGKRCQAAGGAKNVLLVMPDAEPDSTLRAIMGSAFGCAGQRCMAGSVLMGIGEGTADDWRERVGSALARLRVADASSDDLADMGALIDAHAQQRIQIAVGKAVTEGAKIAYQGSAPPEKGFFAKPTLMDAVGPEMAIFREEVFGPVLSLLRPGTLDEAIGIMNSLAFGNGATIFTRDGGAARRFVRGMQCGMIGVNVGVPAPMALFPFSGWKGSFFGDLHAQGTEGVSFYTRQKVVLSRWDASYIRNQGW